MPALERPVTGVMIGYISRHQVIPLHLGIGIGMALPSSSVRNCASILVGDGFGNAGSGR